MLMPRVETTLTDIMQFLGEEHRWRAMITTHRHPDSGRDDAVVVVGAVHQDRIDHAPILALAVVRPGPSSAQGWADGVAACVVAMTGYDAIRVDKLDEAPDYATRDGLTELLGA